MVDIIFYTGLVVLGFIIGWKCREMYAQIVINNYFKEHDQKTSDAPASVLISIRKEHGQYYISETQSGKFLVQVSNKDELFDYIRKELNDKTVLIKPDQLALFDV